MARFTSGLSRALSAQGVDVGVVGDAASPYASDEPLDRADVAIVQHDLRTTDDVVAILDGLSVPSIVIIRSVPKSPTAQERSDLEAIASSASRLVVMSDAACRRLHQDYDVDRQKIATIPHGATVPVAAHMKRPSRPTVLTWGWLAPGDGVERVIEVMASLKDVPGRPRYLIAGPTHPHTLAVEGETYREARMEQAHTSGVADSVSFDPRYYDGAMLATLLQQSSVVVLPYDCREKVTSGVLVESIAHGRPVVATAFPHASELLSSGAGAVVDHDDSAGLAATLRQIVTQPRLAGAMAAEARRMAPELAWSTVAGAYLRLAQRLLADEPVRA
ncbi:glycosyltransferase [Mycolicibacterium celeriflavum]|uniref:Glycosyl transferase family 1 n=1 Tax=Mycolicibacterium celeriflavum TaxID=1249101 RepID=A0A7I7RHQ8_MYCCF|nr:glycosyltransferase [Mycolicibacterium celeriflavum]MCV7240377.1 glycosyltransferase [Mycolicibacterium celeriflavum]BBY44118.1 glycosyl transferase family 1 [Mycolicibacterium celeriflavum]